MNQASIWSTLRQTFREVFDDEALEIQAQTTAADVPEWDSLMHIHLLLAVEQAFGVRFNTGEVAALKNVGEMVALIETKLLAQERARV